MPIILKIVSSLVVVYLSYSLIEYFLHRFLQHHKLFRPARTDLLESMNESQLPLNRNFNSFTLRHYVHHAHPSTARHDYEMFDRVLVLGMVAVQLATVFVSFRLVPTLQDWFSFSAMAIASALGALLSTLYYGNIHHLAHDPEAFERVVRKYPFFAAYLTHIRGAHLHHHEHPKGNFNFLYPGCDFIFGTHTRSR